MNTAPVTALSQNPVTNNNLLPNRFRFLIKRAPNVEYWIQEVAVPGFSLDPTTQPNPFVEIPMAGDHIAYEPLGISFLVDANLSNYSEMYRWTTGLGFPDSFAEYAELLKAPTILDKGVRSDLVLTVLNGQQVPKFSFTFRDAFPVAMSGMTLNSTSADLDRVSCHVEFKYTSFHLSPMNVPVGVDVGLS